MRINIFVVGMTMYFSDQDILASMRKDKTIGIQRLFDRYYRPLVLFADEFLKDRSAAEDLVQDFFVKLWEDDYLLKVTASTLGSYLYSAVRNRAISFLQRKDVLRNSQELGVIDISVDVVEDIDEERMDIVMKEVELLPERTRQVVERVMLRGLKYKEAAEELKISINTVKFALKEGTKRLRERLASMGPEVLFYFLRKFSNH